WWVSVGIETDSNYSPSKTEGIGIDLGIKDLAVCSDGKVYGNINKTKRIRQLEKKKRRLQRKISRKYQMNKEGSRYKKTRNIIKSEKQLLKVSRRLTNIRHNYIHQITSEIVNRKPMFIVLEDLNVKGM
ncbi:transposase, partial [Caldibacillus thermoamylovorans]|uniref:transposase n=5 Tax=Bacillota TaxID=1239 RepID=UPI00203C98AC